MNKFNSRKWSTYLLLFLGTLLVIGIPMGSALSSFIGLDPGIGELLSFLISVALLIVLKKHEKSFRRYGQFLMTAAVLEVVIFITNPFSIVPLDVLINQQMFSGIVVIIFLLVYLASYIIIYKNVHSILLGYFHQTGQK